MTLTWLQATIICFAAVGFYTCLHWILKGWQRFISVITTLIATLQDAAEVAKAYREDVQILKQIAESAPASNWSTGEEPQSIIPKQDRTPVEMPAPYLNRYPIKPQEPDAPAESVADVDLTPSEEDLLENERQEAAGDFEAQERQKAATRAADLERLRESASEE